MCGNLGAIGLSVFGAGWSCGISEMIDPWESYPREQTRYIDAENKVMWILPSKMTLAEFKAGGWKECPRIEWK